MSSRKPKASSDMGRPPKSARCMWMRGGTSKGGVLLKSDLPADPATRDQFLLAIMGSPDPRQINGMGGADPLTSKIAIVSKSARPDADIDYLFLQVAVDEPIVSDAQNCGNMLAAIGPFALERGLIKTSRPQTRIRIFMENTGKIAIATVQTPGGEVTYQGDARIDGVPGTASPVSLAFADTAGSSCGALLPTGKPRDTIDGLDVTLIDNGMPCVILSAAALGISGTEPRDELDNNTALKKRLEAVRLKAGPLMNLGDVSEKTVPKMTLVSPPQHGGTINTRSFIPFRCHASIGVLAAVSVATACLLEGSLAAQFARLDKAAETPDNHTLKIEHPIGQTTILASTDKQGNVTEAAILRTARKLFDGEIFA